MGMVKRCPLHRPSTLAPARFRISAVCHSILAALILQVSAFSKVLHKLFHLFFRLAREQARVRELQSGNQQLEEQRAELVERLQAMLQTHWEEANQLLGTSALSPNPPVGVAP